MTKAFLILGITPTTLYDEAHKKYLALLKKHHPDKGGDLKKAQSITAAWDHVKDKLPKTKEEIPQKEAESQREPDADDFRNQNIWGGVNINWKDINIEWGPNTSSDQMAFELHIQARTQPHNPDLKTLHFNYLTRQELSTHVGLREYLKKYSFFLKLWGVYHDHIKDGGQPFWFYFGSDLNVSRIDCILAPYGIKEYLTSIIPNENFNVNINFRRSTFQENIRHHFYKEKNGSFSIESSPRHDPKDKVKKNSIFICSECESERWAEHYSEKTPTLHCYICNEFRLFNLKTY